MEMRVISDWTSAALPDSLLDSSGTPSALQVKKTIGRADNAMAILAL